jgi:hypothetical protein
VLRAEHVAWMLEVRYAYRTSVRDSGQDSDRKICAPAQNRHPFLQQQPGSMVFSYQLKTPDKIQLGGIYFMSLSLEPLFILSQTLPPSFLTLIGVTLTLNLLTTTIVAPPSNASKRQMGFNSAFKGLKQ